MVFFKESILEPLTETRPAILKQFIAINVRSESTIYRRVIAGVSRLHHHPNRHFYGKSIEVWNLRGTDTSYPSSFLPVEGIAGRCVVNTSTVQESNIREKVTVVMLLCMVFEI